MIELSWLTVSDLPTSLQRRDVRRDAALPLLAVAGRARELDEQVRAHRHVRVARVRALATAPATTAAQSKQPPTKQTTRKPTAEDDAAHTGEYPPRRTSEYNRLPQSEPRSIRPAANSPNSPPMRPVAGRRARHVVFGAAELEVAVPGRPGCPHVTVERHPDAARIDEVGAVRPGPPELLVAVAEDHGPVADPGQHALVVVGRLGREALDVRQRRAVHVEDPVQLGLRRKRVEPLDDLLRQRAPEEVVASPSPPGGRAAALAASARRSRGSTSLPAAPSGGRASRRATDWRPVVAAEQPAVDAELARPPRAHAPAPACSRGCRRGFRAPRIGSHSEPHPVLHGDHARRLHRRPRQLAGLAVHPQARGRRAVELRRVHRRRSVRWRWGRRRTNGSSTTSSRTRIRPSGRWPYDIPCWVFTHRQLPVVPDSGIEFTSADIATVHEEMVARRR